MERADRRPWRRHGWFLFFAVWGLAGLLVIGPMVLRFRAADLAVPWRQLGIDIASWYLWGLLVPPIRWWTRRRPWNRAAWPSWLVLHLAASFVVAVVYVTLTVIKHALLTPDMGVDTATFAEIPIYLRQGLEYYVGAYFLIVVLLHWLTDYRNDLVQANVEGRLALAHLQNLKAQLRPHFLFNTLNAISSLMHRDVDAADSMIVRLAELLRLSLEEDERQQVTLAGELDFLDRYLAIEKIRFRDRLDIRLEIAPDCRDAQVPRLLLQPLVENAIVHGIAMRSAAGRIAIRARREGDRLHLEVHDDGPGLVMAAPREGVGLGNTRKRLDQLYGSAAFLALENAAEGGLRAVVEIPFELDARFPEAAP